jgi:hypothetical protein
MDRVPSPDKITIPSIRNVRLQMVTPDISSSELSIISKEEDPVTIPTKENAPPPPLEQEMKILKTLQLMELKPLQKNRRQKEKQ